jgi:hypothetical protein
MDCTRFHELLERLLADAVDAELRLSAMAHLRGCAECRTVWRLTSEDRSSGSESPGMLSEILQRTSGKTCGRVHERLGDWVDGRLAVDDATLVTEHVHACPDCAQLAHTLRRLAPVLRDLGSLQPDPDFVDDVMRATARPRSSVQRVRQSFVGWWRRALLRPAFPLEAAFVGTVIVVLLTATPLSPLPQLPGRALRVVQELSAAPAAVEAQTATPWDRLLEEIESTPAVQRSRGQAQGWIGRVHHAVEIRARALAPALGELRRDGASLGRALIGLRFEELGVWLTELGADLEDLWTAFRDPSPRAQGTNEESDPS